MNGPIDLYYNKDSPDCRNVWLCDFTSNDYVVFWFVGTE